MCERKIGNDKDLGTFHLGTIAKEFWNPVAL